MDEEDYMGGGHRGARVPLLTGIEAPSVTLASDDFNPEDLLESARPKSGMKSAFMNMANSIM
jgi:sodium-coupled neutral amino acid transporter 11